MKGIPFSESSPNIPREKILVHKNSPIKPVKTSKVHKKNKFKVPKGSKMNSANKVKLHKERTDKQSLEKPKHKNTSSSAKAKQAAAASGDYSKATIITRAAVRRIAAKHDIPQISSECVDQIIKHVTERASLCLLRARSSARHISRTRTIQVPNLASAARGCRMGDLIHA